MSKAEIWIAANPASKTQGIYRLWLDRVKGKLEGPWLYYECAGIETLDAYRYELAVGWDGRMQDGVSGVTLLDTHQPTPFVVASRKQENHAPCSLAQDRNFIYTVNGDTGRLIVYRKAHGELIIEHQVKLGADAKCRQVFLLDDYLYVVCAGWDRIRILNPHNEYSLVRDLSLPKGSMPCLVRVDAAHQYLYVLCEAVNEVYVYQKRAHLDFHCHQIVACVPKGGRNTCMSRVMRISPDGNFLYTAAAGMNIITCFAIINGNLSQQEMIESGGVCPCDLWMDESQRWMLVLNRDSDKITLFQCEPQSGKAIAVCDEVTLPHGISMTFAYYR